MGKPDYKPPLLWLAAGVMMLAAAGFCALLWYSGYWAHRDCIEQVMREGGSGCFVAAEGVTYAGGAAYLIWLALAFLGLALACFRIAWRGSRTRGRATL